VAADRIGRRILITGISGPLAGHVARQLETRDDVEEIIGVDVHEPAAELRRTEFVRADVRNPLVARIVETAGIDTVVHTALSAGPMASGGRARMKEHNVIGSMQLLAACQRSPAVKRFVLKSSTAVYGSDPADPALFREDDRSHSPATSGFGKDVAEVEGYARGFARRRPDATVTILRFANFLGGELDSVLASFFALPVVPSVLGFDPRLQFLHEHDGIEVLRRAVLEDHAGVFNVAGDGVVFLSQCVRKAGRVQIMVPRPMVSAVAAAVRRSRRVDFSSDQLAFLQFGRVVDITRLVRDFGYLPRYTTPETFDDFIARRRIRAVVKRDDVVRWEREVYDFLQRKGQERFLASRRERPVEGSRR
jgi:UDP-glucose 4-epimerase